MARGYFVTGTDTGVGKTTVAVELIHALNKRGLKVAAMKPVAAGCEWVDGQMVNEDVTALNAAASVKADRSLVNPYAFIPPIAPNIAAMQAGIAIDCDKIISAYTALASMADVVVVEGVGGFRVPLGNNWDTGDLAVTLGLPIVLVVGVRLGCLNHALLTAESIKHAGLAWAGWVASILDTGMPALDENLAALALRLPAPCLGRLSASTSAVVPVPDARLHTGRAPKMHWNEKISTLE